MFDEDECELSLTEKIEKMDIKPCPFCGGKVYITFTDEEGYEAAGSELAEYVEVRCDKCQLLMSNTYVVEEEVYELIDRWNKRVGDKDV